MKLLGEEGEGTWQIITGVEQFEDDIVVCVCAFVYWWSRQLSHFHANRQGRHGGNTGDPGVIYLRAHMGYNFRPSGYT